MRFPKTASALAVTLLLAAPPGLANERGAVDVHLHLHPLGLDAVMGKGSSGRRPGLGRIDTDANLATAADNLVKKMEASGVERGLVVVVPSPVRDAESEYRGIRDAVRRHPERLALLAGGATLGTLIRDTDPDRVTPDLLRRFEQRAEKLLAEGAVGFGEMVSYHLCLVPKHSFQVALPDHPLFLKLADIAARHDVAIDLHMEAVETETPMPANLRRACTKNPETLTPTVPRLEKLLAHNRAARIVWQHIGWDNAGQMNLPMLRRMLETHPNLFMALRVEKRPFQIGGGGPMPNRIVDRNWHVKPAWRAFITDFQDRLVIGSDEFFSPTEGGAKMAASFDQTWWILRQFPPEVGRKIGRDNAVAIYRLD